VIGATDQFSLKRYRAITITIYKYILTNHMSVSCQVFSVLFTATMSSVVLAVKSRVIVWLLPLAVVAAVRRGVCVTRVSSGVATTASPSLSVAASMANATICFTNSSILAITVRSCARVQRMAR